MLELVEGPTLADRIAKGPCQETRQEVAFQPVCRNPLRKKSGHGKRLIVNINLGLTRVLALTGRRCGEMQTRNLCLVVSTSPPARRNHAVLRRVIGRRVAPTLVALAMLSLGACDDGTLVEVLTFADRLDVGDHRHEVSHDFDAGEERPRISGWSHSETLDNDVSFVWAVGREAELVLDITHPDDIQWLHFRCWPFNFGLGSEQQVRVSLNSTQLGVVELSPVANLYSLPIPDGSLETGENTLSFAFSLTKSPSAQDQRPLAAAFDFVQVSRRREIATALPGQRGRPVEADGSDFVLPGSSSLAFSLSLPNRAVLEFGARSDDQSLSEAELTVLDVTGQETVVWSGRSTRSRRVDLSGLAGQPVDLIFRAIGDGTDSVRWLSPRLLGDVGETNLATNVLFVVVDTLRADHVGVYGSNLHTPNIDALARSGVRFDRAYSSIPITGPSHASMFTSLLPRVHGVRNNLQALPDDHVTLAEVLRAAYRRTSAFVSLGVIRAPSGLNQGFDEYFDEFGLDWWKTAEEMNDQVVPWLERVKGSFFLWAHYSDPHEPYAPPGPIYPRVMVQGNGLETVEISAESRSVSLSVSVPPGGTDIEVYSVAGSASRPIRVRDLRVRNSRVEVTCPSGCDGPADSRIGAEATIRLHNPTQTATDVYLRFRLDELALNTSELREAYRQEVEYTDQQIGALLSALDRSGRRRDTLVILTADHGEGLGDHDYLGHAGALFEEQLRVPLILSWPAGLPAGKTVEVPVSLIDVLPTITDLLAIRDDSFRSGRSLVSLIEHETGRDEAVPILAETFRPQAGRDRRAVIAGGFKLILSSDEQRTMLYDLTLDPSELEDRARDWPDLELELRQTMDQFEGSYQRTPPTSELTDEQTRRLRSLGYVR